jgi:hypothetical protein
MASSETQNPGRIRRSFFGYHRGQADQQLEEARRALSAAQEELGRAREAADTTGALGHHLAAMLTRFSESVTAGEKEATERAATIVADAETRAELIEAQARELLQQARDVAAATFAEAGRRYEAATEVRRVASERIESAIERMSDALASINALPDFPDLVLPVPNVHPTTNVISFEPASWSTAGARSTADHVDHPDVDIAVG